MIRLLKDTVENFEGPRQMRETEAAEAPTDSLERRAGRDL